LQEDLAEGLGEILAANQRALYSLP